MNELETYKISLKIWNHNSQKQKSYSILKNKPNPVYFEHLSDYFPRKPLEVAENRELRKQFSRKAWVASPLLICAPPVTKNRHDFIVSWKHLSISLFGFPWCDISWLLT